MMILEKGAGGVEWLVMTGCELLGQKAEGCREAFRWPN